MMSKPHGRTIQGIFLAILSWVLALAILVASDGNGQVLDAKELIEGLPTNQFYINGTWIAPVNEDLSLEVIDPSTATVVASLAVAGPKDVDAAVTAAKEAWPS